MSAVQSFRSRLAANGSPMGNRQGFVNNWSGGKCWYTQKATADNSISCFFQKMTGSDTLLVFDGPTCMFDNSGGHGTKYNQTTINNFITRWYFPGSAFRTEPADLYFRSMLQIRGWRIQSSSHPTQPVFVEYFADAQRNLGAVVHQCAIQGCG